MDKNFTPKISVFHCINAFTENTPSLLSGGDDFQIKFIRLPCSGMVKDVVLLRAFEAGADAVVVLVCPEGQCRYLEGNLRAKKRVEWVKNLLDDIGLDRRRLSFNNISAGDQEATSLIVTETLKELSDLGPNPAV